MTLAGVDGGISWSQEPARCQQMVVEAAASFGRRRSQVLMTGSVGRGGTARCHQGGRGSGLFRQTTLAGADDWIRRSRGHGEVSPGWSRQRPLSADDARRVVEAAASFGRRRSQVLMTGSVGRGGTARCHQGGRGSGLFRQTILVGVDGQIRCSRGRGEVSVGGGQGGGLFWQTMLAGVDGRFRRLRGHGEVSAGGGQGCGIFRQTTGAGADGRIHRSWPRGEVLVGGGRCGDIFRHMTLTGVGAR
ncbi:hypothetical protein TRIUR3_08794 [Triticum urartu]|uniref:Uncharacterized protein n=1 Tax=Triticum urartu TaxID=4572 RepID=M7YQ79_TRIUA|nr:hypothetical protein TRIUR3_08794 [Triticum urartu]